MYYCLMTAVLAAALSGCASVRVTKTYVGDSTYSFKGAGNAFANETGLEREVLKQAFRTCQQSHKSGFQLISGGTATSSQYLGSNCQGSYCTANTVNKPSSAHIVKCTGPIDGRMHQQVQSWEFEDGDDS